MSGILNAINNYLGLDTNPLQLTFLQTSLRAIVVFLVSLVMIRLANKRFLSKNTAFDALLGFILASMLARAVNGSASFFPTLGAGFVLVALHRLIAALAQSHHRFGNLVKGHASVVVEDGVIKEDVLRKHRLSDHDLLEDLRMNGNVEDPQKVRRAYLERNGHVSVVK